MKTIGLTLVLLGTIPLPLPAQVDPGWIGKRLVPRSSDFTLVVNGEAIDRSREEVDLYRVEQADGTSLLLKAEADGASGWAERDQVVLAEHAVEFFTQQIHRQPGNAFNHAARAVLWTDKQEYDNALRDYNEAIRLDPRHASYYRGRGRVWQLMNECDKSITDFNEAIKLDPKSARAFIGRGTAWASQKKYGKAIDDASEAIWLDPLSITAYEIRGRAWYAKKEFAKAIVDYNTALRLNSRVLNLTATAATPGLLSTGTTGPCLISTKRSRSMKSVPMPTAAAHGSGPPVPSANTATAPRPSPPRRAPANLRAITTSNRSKRSRQPTPRQVISSRLSNGKHGPTGYARTLRKSRRARHGSNYSSRKSPCANLALERKRNRGRTAPLFTNHQNRPRTNGSPGRSNATRRAFTTLLSPAPSGHRVTAGMRYRSDAKMRPPLVPDCLA